MYRSIESAVVNDDSGAEAGGSAPTTDAVSVVESATRGVGEEWVLLGADGEEGEDGVTGADERCRGCFVYHLHETAYKLGRWVGNATHLDQPPVSPPLIAPIHG